MNQQEKKTYLEQYKKAKENGVPFFPDILFKDAVASLLIFLILVALAYFVGAPLEERANPADTNYTPRPEWYFLFLFQLLKYFPGELEVIGVFVIPTLAVLGLFALPFLDKGPRRHFRHRPIVTVITSASMLGIIGLSVVSIRETPPPIEVAQGDETAALYADNCAGCHGTTVDLPPGTNLHTIIAQGSHEGMPAWSADLTSDEIDVLAGFILSPLGSDLYVSNCGTCHEVSDLVASNPVELGNALQQEGSYPPHQDVVVPPWLEILDSSQRSALLNFLVAPDGQRLFAVDCSPCHGRSVPFSGEEEELRDIILEGGLHLKMPPWQERLSPAELDDLAQYVFQPGSTEDGAGLFAKYCIDCHGPRVPKADDVVEAREIIASGGSHETMPVWGDVLTPEQLDALVQYTLAATRGEPLEMGQELFAENCVSCHGDFGEGGLNPARTDDIIAPISTAEYLKTRDDFTLIAIVAQGQPNFGMSPFGTAFGGPLDDGEIEAIVQYMRSWEANPPVELPPEIVDTTVSVSGAEIFTDICAQCHDPLSENFVEITLRERDFRASNSEENIFDTINSGHKATAMIAWGAVLSSEQIDELVKFIVRLPILEVSEASEEEAGAGEEGETAAPVPSFAVNIFPIFDSRCLNCHEAGGDGGWDGRTYDSVMTTGDNAPTIIPGDVENSLLVQKLLNVQEDGDMMPPRRPLTEDQVQVILDWIAAGAPNN